MNSLQAPTVKPVVRSGDVLQTLRLIKPRLDLVCMRERECVHLRGVMAIFISASGPPRFPVHQAPAVVEASQALCPVTLL